MKTTDSNQDAEMNLGGLKWAYHLDKSRVGRRIPSTGPKREDLDRLRSMVEKVEEAWKNLARAQNYWMSRMGLARDELEAEAEDWTAMEEAHDAWMLHIEGRVEEKGANPEAVEEEDRNPTAEGEDWERLERVNPASEGGNGTDHVDLDTDLVSRNRDVDERSKRVDPASGCGRGSGYVDLEMAPARGAGADEDTPPEDGGGVVNRSTDTTPGSGCEGRGVTKHVESSARSKDRYQEKKESGTHQEVTTDNKSKSEENSVLVSKKRGGVGGKTSNRGIKEKEMVPVGNRRAGIERMIPVGGAKVRIKGTLHSTIGGSVLIKDANPVSKGGDTAIKNAESTSSRRNGRHFVPVNDERDGDTNSTTLASGSGKGSIHVVSVEDDGDWKRDAILLTFNEANVNEKAKMNSSVGIKILEENIGIIENEDDTGIGEVN